MKHEHQGPFQTKGAKTFAAAALLSVHIKINSFALCVYKSFRRCADTQANPAPEPGRLH